jgi:hypothetical protein
MAKENPMDHSNHRDRIVGWGYDLARENRPGVPMNRHPPRPIGTPHWSEPSQQQTDRASLVSATREITPVYASTGKPRGLSGLVRQVAYRTPEYRPRRWLMLMLADRIDAIEHDVTRASLVLAGAGLLIMGWLTISRRRARS